MKKKIIMGAIGLVLLAILGGGGWILWKRIAAKRAAQPAPAAEAALKGEEEDEPASGGEGAAAPAVMVYPKIVNLDRKNAYLKVELHIIFRDPELGKAATSDKPTPEASEIRAMLLEMLSGKTLEEASDLETRELVRKEIKDKLNEKFGPKPGVKEDSKHKRSKKPIKDVLVVDWAISA